MDAVHAGSTAQEFSATVKAALASNKTIDDVVLVYRDRAAHLWRILDLETAKELVASYKGSSPPPEIVPFASLGLPESIYDEWLTAQNEYLDYCESCGNRMDDEQEMRAASYEADVRRVMDRIADAVDVKFPAATAAKN